VFALLRADSDPRVAVRWLWAGFGVRIVLGDLKGAREMAEQALARAASDPSCLCEAHHAMAGALMFLGELETARRHFDAALEAYDLLHPQRTSLGSDLGVFANAWSSHALWLLGDEPLAIERAREAILLAERGDDPYSRTLALAYAALLHQLRRDVDRVLGCARDAVALCERHGFAYYDDWARTLIGWARGQTHPHDGVLMIREALYRLDARRAQARRPYYLSLLAETLARAGNRNAAGSTLDAAINMALDRGDVWWLPALYLQKSELEPPAARDAIRDRGLALARAQGSRSLEQRILAAGAGTLARTVAERSTS
jgi:tetratricopeptide (TPR) repeat protein